MLGLKLISVSKAGTPVYIMKLELRGDTMDKMFTSYKRTYLSKMRYERVKWIVWI